MFTYLDLLIVVFMSLIALALLSVCLLFLLKNKIAKRIFFYVTLVIGLYASWVAIAIGSGGGFIFQMDLGILTAIVCVSTFVFERIKGKDEKKLRIAYIIAAVTMIVALFNAIL